MILTLDIERHEPLEISLPWVIIIEGKLYFSVKRPATRPIMPKFRDLSAIKIRLSLSGLYFVIILSIDFC